MEKKKIVITGATGFVGGAVARELLAHDYDLIVLSRRPEEAKRIVPGARDYVAWQPEENGAWFSAIDGADGVIHCASASLNAQRWADANARASLQDRLIATRGLVNAIRQAKIKPSVFIHSSAQGIYGFNVVSDTPVDENTPMGSDFWAHDNKAWEDAALLTEPYTRVVLPRIGFVMGATDGGLVRQVQLILKNQGGVSKPANAYVSWVHVKDVARLYCFAIENENVRGAINATAPNPVIKTEYAELLSKKLGRPVNLAPYFLARLFMGRVAEVYSRQRRVIPRKALDLGFKFEYPTLEQALDDLIPQILNQGK